MEANHWFWTVVGIMVTLAVGVWLLTLLAVVFGPLIVWVGERLDKHVAKHPARITTDQHLRQR